MIMQPLLGVLFHAHTSSGSSLIAHVEGIASFLFLGGACSGFRSLGWAAMSAVFVIFENGYVN